MSKLRRHLILGSLLLCAGVSGCKDKKEIKVYRVSKAEDEAPARTAMPAQPEMGTMPPMGSPMAPALPDPQVTPVTGNPPSDWEAQPLTSMRQASFVVKGSNGALADISLVSLAGPAGGALDNVNRWLGQLGKPAITAEQLEQMAQLVPSPLGEVTIVDLEGLQQGADPAKDGRIIAGIVPGTNGTLFFKMRGNAGLTASQKAAFIAWISTVREAAPGPARATSPAPASTAPVSASPQIKWQVPETWKPVPPSPMRHASFSVTGENGESADISVIVFDGNGGGDLENVNRWRGQIGLEPLSPQGLEPLIVPVTAKESRILTVDMSGGKARILAGWTRAGGKSWFFKLTAPDKLAEAEKPAFLEFLQSVQFQP